MGEVSTRGPAATRAARSFPLNGGHGQLTDAGSAAVDRIREAGARGMRPALSDWAPEDLRPLATLFHRMVDGFLACAVEDDGERQAAVPGV
ncbi:hypothetical protein [Streptomyces sp. NPDC058291]|uniref:hypothetical protein n=1 Tax=Streptomyces sp. NPDC058291 TaxID=3346427 RepID=UPI0036E5B939